MKKIRSIFELEDKASTDPKYAKLAPKAIRLLKH